MKPGRNCCQLPFETTEEGKEKIQEEAAILAAKISVDAAILVLFPLKKTKKTFLSGREAFTFLLTGFGRSSV